MAESEKPAEHVEYVIPPVTPDQPATEDFLGFEPYAQTLFDLIRDETTLTPLTIGIFGSWGSGKTSLMRMIRKKLKDLRAKERRSGKSSDFSHLPVWFNAWLYSGERSLGRALILCVLSALRRELASKSEALRALDKIETNLYRTIEPASLGEMSISGAALLSGSQQGAELRLPMTMGMDILDKIIRAAPESGGEAGGENKEMAAIKTLINAVDQIRTESERARMGAMEAFRRDFANLVKKYIYPRFLVVFVDDLDRCLPEKAVEVLEAIKLFFEVQNCIFILGIDRDVIKRGVRLRYGEMGGLGQSGALPFILGGKELESDDSLKRNALRYRAFMKELLEEGEEIIDGGRYLEKIIQIPLTLPPIDRAAMAGYVSRIAPRLEELDHRCDDVFAVGMEPNPRRVKRTLNIFLLLWRLSRNRDDLRERIKAVRLAKTIVIQLHHQDLFELLPRAPHLIIDLERRFRQEKEQSERERRQHPAAGPLVSRVIQARSDRENEREKMAEATGPIAPFLGNTRLRELLTVHKAGEPDANFIDMTPAQVLSYVHLSHSAAEAWASREAAPPTLEPQLVRVPAGTFEMGMTPEAAEETLSLYSDEGLGTSREWMLAQTPLHKLELPAFDIGRYLVTNADYAAFVDAAKGRISPPRHWSSGSVPPELASHPVVNVTWQDARAYCHWLSEKTDKTYRLPSEAEWEKAASWNQRQGQKRVYPWGDKWEAARCNNRESSALETTPQSGTSPVGEFSQAGGDSAYGISDMAGNVWEWTLSKWGRDREKPAFAYPYERQDDRESPDGPDLRVLRGGSFYDGPGWCRSTSRFPNEPLLAADYIGFRVVRVAEDANAPS